MLQLLLVTGLALGLQFAVRGWHNSGIRRLTVRPSRSAFNDWLFFFLGLTNLPILSLIAFYLGLALFLGFGGAWIRSSFENWRVPIDTGFVILDGALYYLMFTLADYWNHRLWHTRSGWLLHRMHHSATDYTPLLTQRNHPLQLALEPLVRIWPLVFFEFSSPVVAVVLSLDGLYQAVAHADLPWRWGWFGRWVWLSPQGHKIHHSPLPEHADKNFGILALWDRLFGTWYDGSVPATEVGIAETVHNQRPLWSDLMADSFAFAKSMRDSVVIPFEVDSNSGKRDGSKVNKEPVDRHLGQRAP